MSRRPPFEPIGFARYLEDSQSYRIANDQFFHWTGTHWVPMTTRESERLALDWIESGAHGIANSANAKQACATAMLKLPELKAPTRSAVIPVKNGYIHLHRSGVNLLLTCPLLAMPI